MSSRRTLCRERETERENMDVTESARRIVLFSRRGKLTLFCSFLFHFVGAFYKTRTEPIEHLLGVPSALASASASGVGS